MMGYVQVAPTSKTKSRHAAKHKRAEGSRNKAVVRLVCSFAGISRLACLSA